MNEAGALHTLRRRLSPGRATGVLVALVLVCVYLAITEPVFWTWDNFTNIVRANTVLFILAIGMTFVVLTAGFDLSVASLLVACVMIMGLAVDAGWSWVLALSAAVGVGLLLGFVNGFLIGVVGISFAVVTLGTLAVYQGFALLTTDGEVVSLFDAANLDPVETIVNSEIGPIPILLIICVAIYLVASYVLRYTAFGRSVFAVGSNPEAARLMGIRVTLVLISVYTIVGLCAGLASLVQVGRLTAAAPQADPTLLLTVVAAVLIGGTSFTGGEGGLFGTLVGVLFLGVIANGLALSDISTFWQGVISGIVLIVAVGLNVIRDRALFSRLRIQLARPRGGTGGEEVT